MVQGHVGAPGVQLRAALAGTLTAGRVTIREPYLPWLVQLAGDLRWMMARVASAGRREDMDRCHYGQGCIDRWLERDMLDKLFDPTEVAWFRHLTVDPKSCETLLTPLSRNLDRYRRGSYHVTASWRMGHYVSTWVALMHLACIGSISMVCVTLSRL